MTRTLCFLSFTLAYGFLIPLTADDEIVFRSDVNMIRVDTQVLDRDNRAITGLRVTDFVLREEGRPVEIRNFARENMPMDVLLLLDVSASMRPHVQRVSSAAHQAMQSLGAGDRVAIMVFDRSARLRLPFRNSHQDVERELESLPRQETFNGGTDITRGLIDAAEYVGRAGRRDARRAIVILTDDETEGVRDDEGVSRALTRADAVLSALIAPDAMRNSSISRGGGGYPGGGYPGSRRGPLGGIIIGPGGGGGGRRNGPATMGHRTHSAGTADLARASGGDSMPVDDAYALETTLARIRQRYALYFYLPPGVRAGEERGIEVQLADSARQRYYGADVRYRRIYLAPGNSEPQNQSQSPDVRRRRPVYDGPRNGPLDVGSPDSDPPNSDQGGGWRQLKPNEKP